MKLDRRRCLGAFGLLGMGWATSRAEDQPARRIEWPDRLPLIGAAPLTRDELMAQDVVLGFSSATCSHCLRQDTHLQRLHERASPRLLVLGVSTDANDEELTRLRHARGWTYPWTREHQTLAARFDARRVLPRTYLVARGGQVLRAIPGEMFEADVLELADLAQGGAR